MKNPKVLRDSQGRNALEILDDWAADDPDEVAIIKKYIAGLTHEAARWRMRAQGKAA
jgi:hypothetical protein